MRRAAAAVLLLLLVVAVGGATAVGADGERPRVRWNPEPLPVDEWSFSQVDGVPGGPQLLPPATGEYEARPPFYVR